MKSYLVCRLASVWSMRKGTREEPKDALPKTWESQYKELNTGPSQRQSVILSVRTILPNGPKSASMRERN